jgi:hypothetical protein
MTSQATNRREGVSTSCRGRSRKLHAFTEKELETVRAAQELLGAPNHVLKLSQLTIFCYSLQHDAAGIQTSISNNSTNLKQKTKRL